MPALSRLFSLGGDPAKTKLLLLSRLDSFSEHVSDWVRSLNIEHVSPAGLMRQEISRPKHGLSAADEAVIARMRKWFWARKPDAGFALAGFPATLLHALVFDEWLEARNEALDAALAAGASASGPVVEHYRSLGLDIIEVGTGNLNLSKVD